MKCTKQTLFSLLAAGALTVSCKTDKDDRLARFFYEEPLPPHNKVVEISDEEMDQTFDF